MRAIIVSLCRDTALALPLAGPEGKAKFPRGPSEAESPDGGSMQAGCTFSSSNGSEGRQSPRACTRVEALRAVCIFCKTGFVNFARHTVTLDHPGT